MRCWKLSNGSVSATRIALFFVWSEYFDNIPRSSDFYNKELPWNKDSTRLAMMDDSKEGSRGEIPKLALSGGYLRCNVAVAFIGNEERFASHFPLSNISCIHEEINLGRVIGTGGFSVVNEVKSVDLDEIYDMDAKSSELRARFASSVRNSEGIKYVLKTLRNDLPDEDHEKGVEDLAIEAEFLQVLQHPNIVSMRAVSQSDPRRSRYFVVLDYLPTTLDLKFNYWRTVVGENTGFWIPCYGYCCSKDVVLHNNWKERLNAAADIASALQYLHHRNVIYRDLKPDNIGFDSNGRLKLFDFGLAKSLDAVQREEEHGNFYLLTGNTGSLRYMAPEVARDEPYNLTADCYSFGILFWQICSLTTPYAGFTQQTHSLNVVQRGMRPKPDKSWPHSWTTLMTAAWNVDPSQRPSMTEIEHQLCAIIDEITEEDGVVPSRASEIRAKKKRKKVSRENQVLDVDTRITEGAEFNDKNLRPQHRNSEII